MGKKYAITDKEAMYFISFSTVGWVDVFSRKEYRDILIQNLKYCQENKGLIIYSWCIMSNHVHVLMTLLGGAPALSVILQNIKKFTAVQSNKLLSRTGKFWAEESFDTIIRNEKHFYHTIHYIINNPVKAGLVNNWWEWKWTYLCEELVSEYRLEKTTSNNK